MAQLHASVADGIGKPTIAMISGFRLGAGRMLALRGDLRDCTADPSISAPDEAR